MKSPTSNPNPKSKSRPKPKSKLKHQKTPLSQIMGSPARFRILEIMCGSTCRVSVRQLEALTGLAVRSVQVAMAFLEREQVVKKTQSGRHVLFALNKCHSYFDLLQNVFLVVKGESLKLQAAQYKTKAKQVLAFCGELQELVGKAKIR